jgi:hypothetical protein
MQKGCNHHGHNRYKEGMMDFERRRERHRVNRAKYRQRARDGVAAYLSVHPCVDCGETDPIVLTFDHVRGEKSNDIANMVSEGQSLESIMAEIEKTEVRCFNCHAVRTHERSKSNRWKRVNGG